MNEALRASLMTRAGMIWGRGVMMVMMAGVVKVEEVIMNVHGCVHRWKKER